MSWETPAPRFDDLIHAPTRLRITAALATATDLEFSALEDALGISTSLLSKQLKLLADAGYPNGFEVTMNCPNDRYVNDEAICQAVTAMWTRIGVKTTLQAAPMAQFVTRVMNNDVSAYINTAGKNAVGIIAQSVGGGGGITSVLSKDQTGPAGDPDPSSVDVFGFHLATIDMRQDSSVNEACVAELLKSARICDNYSDLDEEEKIQILLSQADGSDQLAPFQPEQGEE